MHDGFISESFFLRELGSEWIVLSGDIRESFHLAGFGYASLVVFFVDFWFFYEWDIVEFHVVVHDDFGSEDCSVSRHLHGSEFAQFESFVSEFFRPVLGWVVAEDATEDKHVVVLKVAWFEFFFCAHVKQDCALKGNCNLIVFRGFAGAHAFVVE